MKGTIIVNTLYFQYSSGIGFQIDDQFLRGNDSDSTLDMVFGDVKAWDVIGRIFKQSITNRPYFLQSGLFVDRLHCMNQVQNNMTVLNEFFNFLWFAKDSSAQIKQSGGIMVGPPGFAFTVGEGNSYSRSDGSFSDEAFTEADIDLAYKHFNAYSIVNILPASYKQTNEIQADNYRIEFSGESEYHELNRIQRAYRFLKLGRSTKELPLKISFYILVLECLFSANDSSELSHKVAERAAFFIENNPEQRVESFRIIKKCYNIRSRYIHGQHLDPSDHTSTKLKTKSKELDDLLRRILSKVLLQDANHFLSNQNLLETWFVNLVFNPEQLGQSVSGS